MQTIEQHIGEAVRIERQRLGMRQRELAESLSRALGREWTTPALSNLEAGRRAITASELAALADLLRCPVHHLLRRRGSPEVFVGGELGKPDGTVVTLMQSDDEARESYRHTQTTAALALLGTVREGAALAEQMLQSVTVESEPPTPEDETEARRMFAMPDEVTEQ